MIQDFPQANARLAEVARHWADGEVTHETWRRERRNILREICSKRADYQARSPLPVVQAPRPVEAPVAPVQAESKVSVAVVEPASDIANDEVLTLALLLVAVVMGALFVFFLA